MIDKSLENKNERDVEVQRKAGSSNNSLRLISGPPQADADDKPSEHMNLGVAMSLTSSLQSVLGLLLIKPEGLS